MLELFKIPNKKNQITSVWEYDNEKHMNEVRTYLSKNNNLRITNKKDPYIQVRKQDRWQLQHKDLIINNC